MIGTKDPRFFPWTLLKRGCSRPRLLLACFPRIHPTKHHLLVMGRPRVFIHPRLRLMWYPKCPILRYPCAITSLSLDRVVSFRLPTPRLSQEKPLISVSIARM